MAITPSQARSMLERLLGVSAVVGMAGAASACGGTQTATESAAKPPPAETACSDGEDNDGDGDVDCRDDDCRRTARECSGPAYAAPF